MTDTPNLGLPFIAASQAQKHVTHNEALRILDSAVQIAVLDITRTVPPASPVEGQRHIVAAGPTGVWSGKAKTIATWQDGAWAFLNSKTGWCVWSVADGAMVVFDGSAWRDTRGLSYDNLVHLGVNTTASSPNLLAVKSNAALFAAITVAESGSGDVRVQLSKEGAAKTASLVFADAYSGRAEFGLSGDDDFHVKVSADGATWTEAIRIDRSTGKVTFPATGAVREQLAANRTYYVRTDGSDANTGLANTAGGAFLTIQKAVNAIAALDIAGFTATVQIGDGTYSAGLVLKNVVGFSAAGNLVIKGNAATPGNVLIATTAADGFLADGLSSSWDVKDLKITTTTSGSALMVRNGAALRWGNLNFGATAASGSHVEVYNGARAACLSSYAVSGSAAIHWKTFDGGIILASTGYTITLSGTPSFTCWAMAGTLGALDAYGLTFSGAATGQRYQIYGNGAVFVAGAALTYFPGSTAGAIATGGQYN